MMEFKPVKSSNIEAIGYDSASKTLGVRFKGGGIYHYEGVSEKEHEGLLKADSHGAHFHKTIKSKYSGVKQDAKPK